MSRNLRTEPPPSVDGFVVRTLTDLGLAQLIEDAVNSSGTEEGVTDNDSGRSL
jgi:hypothetical protein